MGEDQLCDRQLGGAGTIGALLREVGGGGGKQGYSILSGEAAA